MGSYDFAVNTGQVSPDRFSTILASNRSDGEQRNSPLSIHNEESADIRLARSLANEMINVSGAEVKVYARTDNHDYDNVHDADPDPTYWSPIYIKAFFKPEPIQVELKEWGVEAVNTTEVVFSHHQIYEHLQERMLRQGDIIQLPYNAASISPKNFRVLNATPSGNFRYTWLYLTCQVQTLTADITVRVNDDNDMSINNNENDGGYRESI